MRPFLVIPALLSLSLPVFAQDISQQPVPMTGVRPMHGQARHVGAQATAPSKPSKVSARQDTKAGAGSTAEMSGDREYQGGVGSPTSTAASNTTAANTRSGIAPRLPDPSAASSTPEAYLAAARSALAAGKTGMAQEALERAETRLLSRSTDPSMAATPADMPLIQQISAARQALAQRDTVGAQAALGGASGDSVPLAPARRRAPR